MSDQRIQTGVTESQPTGIAEGLPSAPPIHDDRAEPDVLVSEPTAMEVFFAWEKLRVLFNIVAIINILLGPKILLPLSPFNSEMFLLALLMANVFASIGPTGENYLSWFGFRRTAARIIMFASLAILLLLWCWLAPIADATRA